MNLCNTITFLKIILLTENYSVFFNLFSNVNFKRKRNYEFYDKNGQYKLLKTQI